MKRHMWVAGVSTTIGMIRLTMMFLTMFIAGCSFSDHIYKYEIYLDGKLISIEAPIKAIDQRDYNKVKAIQVYPRTLEKCNLYGEDEMIVFHSDPERSDMAKLFVIVNHDGLYESIGLEREWPEYNNKAYLLFDLDGDSKCELITSWGDEMGNYLRIDRIGTIKDKYVLLNILKTDFEYTLGVTAFPWKVLFISNGEVYYVYPDDKWGLHKKRIVYDTRIRLIEAGPVNDDDYKHMTRK